MCPKFSQKAKYMKKKTVHKEKLPRSDGSGLASKINEHLKTCSSEHCFDFSEI
jgi:hypothetical protein